MKRSVRVAAILIILMATTAISTSCSSGVSVNGDVGYTPPFLPVTLTIDTNGNIAIHGDASIVTPVGTFTVAANVSKGFAGTSGNTLLIIRHRKGGSIVDDVYTVQSDKIIVIVDGLTELTVTNERVFLDATKAHIRSIEIRSSGGTPPPQPVATNLPFTDPLTSAHHAEGWPNGPYYPPPGDGADPAIYCGFGSQGLQVGPSVQSGNWAVCNNQDLNIGDADITVTARLASIDTSDLSQDPNYISSGYGILVRGNCGEGTQPVGFTVDSDGTWNSLATLYPQLQPVNPAIHKGLGAINVLRIRAIGTHFVFYVNGVQIGGADVADVSATGGVCLTADMYESVVFSNLTVSAP